MKLTVLGPGCWGLTLAWLLNDNFDEVTIWGRESDLYEDLVVNKHCSKPLEVQLDQKVEITSDLKKAIDGADIILSVVATSGVRPVCEQLKAAGIRPDVPLVNASKGLELNTLMRMSEVIKDVLPEQKVVILSGPTLAKEVLQGKPTAASVACEDMQVAEFVQKACNVPNRFRLYTNSDVIGVELGGSLKNVIAIASGFAHSMDLGDNCMGSLLTRGMAEIVRLVTAMGGKTETFYGLSGMGDLIVTCTSMHSRNRRAGILIGQGKTPEEAKKEVGMVVEGIVACESAYKLALKYNVDMPIVTQAHAILNGEINLEDAVNNLMQREKKAE